MATIPTKEEFNEMCNRVDKLHNLIQSEVGASTLDLIDELIALTIEIEKDCNV